MVVLPIVTGKDTPILRRKTVRVPAVTKDIQKLLKDMEETRISAKGAGIAAPQVNRTERVCIAVIGGKSTALVNPEIVSRSEETETQEEGCLSLPDFWTEVPRSVHIVVRYVSMKGTEQELALSGWDARVVQHEVDHLEGKLITDYAGE